MNKKSTKAKRQPVARKVGPVVRLSDFDRVVTTYARKASGPGWSNRPLWVVVEDRRTGTMREECIQPDQQSEEVLRLYDIAAEVDSALCAAVKRMMPNQVVRGATESRTSPPPCSTIGGKP